MIFVALLLVAVVFFIFSNDKKETSSYNSYKNLIQNYGLTPKTINKKIHVIISFRPNINKVITNILRQTERADLMTIIVPEQYEQGIKNGKDEFCKLIKDTCVIQISGGYAMLAKERENGTILIYVKGENAFENPNSLNQMLMEIQKGKRDIYNFNDAVFIRNSAKIGVNDAYIVDSTFS